MGKTKQIFLVLAALFLMVSTLQAQEINDIFKEETPITWVGLDFSGAIFIGDQERFGSEADTEALLKEWNELMEKEYKKYNIGKSFDKTNVTLALDITIDHNAHLIVSEMFSDRLKDQDHIKPDDVQQILYSYDFGDRTGIGLMCVIEAFNKLNNQASMYFTFFDFATRKVMLTEKMIGVPGGSGVRNNWANAVFYALERLQKKEFEMWRRKYQR